MLRNYIRIAYRHLLKNRIYTLINLSGLSVGFACCLLIYLYVSNELGYDSQFNNQRHIYRLIREFSSPTGIGTTPATAAPYGPTLVSDYSADIIRSTRIFPDEGLISIGQRHLQEESLCFADSNFFEMFSFPVIVGNRAEVLDQPNFAVLSEEAAAKYFGDEDPIGQTFEIDGRYSFIVSGIFRNDFRSTLDFEVIVPIAIFRDRSWFNNWRSNGFYTYVQVNSHTNISDLESRFVPFMDERLNQDFERTGSRTDLILQPLSDIYLNTSHEYDFVPHGSSSIVYSSIGIAFFIIAIACINFINLSTAKFTSRLREVGVRKVLGAYRSDLRSQFLVESTLTAATAIAFGIAMLEVVLPVFNAFAGIELDMIYTDPLVWLLILGLMITVGIVAGFYPALFLSNFSAIRIFGGGKMGDAGTANLRRGLVILQFTISVILMASTIVIYQQLQYIQNKELGFDKDQVMIISVNNREFFDRWESFRTNLLNRSDVKAMTVTSGEPGGFHDQFLREIDEQNNQTIGLRTVFSDHDYLNTFGLRVVAGRDFDRKFATDDSLAVILNQAAVRRIGWTVEEAIGKEITEPVVQGWVEQPVTKKVIGVVEDYHFESLRDAIEPLIITIAPTQHAFVGIKLAGGDIANTISAIQDEWKKIVTRHPLDITFLDDKINRLYDAEVKQGNLFTIFSGLAIFIGCLGLYGLVAYSAETRKKEIGIRKVHGATISNILTLLSTEFSRLVLIACLIAIPVTYYLMSSWLTDYAYRIDVSWPPFVVAAVITLFISCLTVSYESFKAATGNPVDALRHE